MKTRWGDMLNENCILPEYPRPQLRRDSYLNLNGRWQYAITHTDNPPAVWDGAILVPFSPESELSGVNRTLLPGETLWYNRTLTLPQGFAGKRVLLHFGAVDQDAVVYANAREVARHEGGYNAFTAELTPALVEGENTLTVRVRTIPTPPGARAASRSAHTAVSGTRRRAASGKPCGRKAFPRIMCRAYGSLHAWRITPLS